jgi:Putative peptidoglycan binding domain
MKNIILSFVVASLAIPATGSAQSSQIPLIPNVGQPNNARVGACYAVVLRDATYTSAPMVVTEREAYDEYAITRAQIGPDRVVSEMTRPAHTVYEAIAPVFEPYSETITTRPAYEELVAPPTDTKQYTDSYVVRQPRLVWRRGANLSGVRRVDSATGEVYCLVEEAAVTQTVTRTVRTNVGDVRRVPVPARTQQITRHRLVRDGGYRAIPVTASGVPVVYNDVTGQARADVSRIAGTSTTIQVQTLATDEKYELVEVACDTAAPGTVMRTSNGPTARSTVTTPGHVVSLRSVQSALKARGLYRGPIDGILGSETSQALRQFQRQNRISGTTLMSIETLRRLGL